MRGGELRNRRILKTEKKKDLKGGTGQKGKSRTSGEEEEASEPVLSAGTEIGGRGNVGGSRPSMTDGVEKQLTHILQKGSHLEKS